MQHACFLSPLGEADNWLVNGKGVWHTWKGEVLLGTSVASQQPVKKSFACNETWYLTSVCLSIVSIIEIDNQKDVTILVDLFIPNQLYMLRAMFSPIVRSTWLYLQDFYCAKENYDWVLVIRCTDAVCVCAGRSLILYRIFAVQKKIMIEFLL